MGWERKHTYIHTLMNPSITIVVYDLNGVYPSVDGKFFVREEILGTVDLTMVGDFGKYVYTCRRGRVVFEL